MPGALTESSATWVIGFVSALSGLLQDGVWIMPRELATIEHAAALKGLVENSSRKPLFWVFWRVWEGKDAATAIRDPTERTCRAKDGTTSDNIHAAWHVIQPEIIERLGQAIHAIIMGRFRERGEFVHKILEPASGLRKKDPAGFNQWRDGLGPGDFVRIPLDRQDRQLCGAQLLDQG